MISVKADGASIRGVINDLGKYDKEKKTAIEREIKSSAVNMRTRALLNARRYPIYDQGGINQNFFFEKNKVMTYSVGNNMRYAPYIEFGTGTTVDVPEELSEYAMQFKGNGVKQINIPARPFLWPAAKEVFNKMEKNILKIIGK